MPYPENVPALLKRLLKRSVGSGLAPLAVALSALQPAAADLKISSPGQSGEKISSCSEYATDVLNDPWDMSNSADILNLIPSADIISLSGAGFSGGEFSARTTADDARFQLLAPRLCDAVAVGGRWGQNYPIDSQKYHLFSMRLYTDQTSAFRIFWNTGCDYHLDRVVSDWVSTQPGWHVYTVDLKSIGHSAVEGGNPAWDAQTVTGLAVQPSSLAGAEIRIDWIRLQDGGGCGQYGVQYASAAGSRMDKVVFLDDDQDPFNGFVSSCSSDDPDQIAVSSAGVPPGEYFVTGFESGDWASVERGDPWDMEGPSDVYLTTSISGVSYQGGQLSGTLDAGQAGIYLELGGKAIDASRYKLLSIKLSQSVKDTPLLFWSSDSLSGRQGMVLDDSYLNNGVYQIDFSNNQYWTGGISELILEPAPNSSGTAFGLDFVALDRNGFSASLDTPAVAQAPAKLGVNHPSRVTFYSPDEKGGEAFRGWNLGATDEVLEPANLYLAEIFPFNLTDGRIGNFFHGRSLQGNRDPVFYVMHPFHPYPSITADAARFKKLSWAMEAPGAANRVDVGGGSMQRVIYRKDDGVLRDGDDIVTLVDGWSAYDWYEFSLDLSSYPLDGGAASQWSGQIDGLRIDPHELLDATDFYFDFVRLRAPVEADTALAIAFSFEDDDDPSPFMNLYYNTSASTAGGSLIGAVKKSDSARTYLWDTSALAAGTYYVYAVADDGLNTTVRLAGGEVVVDHARSQDAAAPLLALEAPAENTSFDTFLQIKGYALDNVRIAAVEASIDQQFLAQFQPRDFNPGAWNAYPDYADSGNSGFDETIDTTALSAGAHTLRVRAVDLAGNSAEATIHLSKSSGNQMAVISDPPPDGTPIPVGGVYTPTATPTPGPLGLTVTLKKSTVMLDADNAGNCAPLSILGAPKKDMKDSQELTSKTGQTSFSAEKVAALVPPQGGAKTKDDGKVYLMASCSDGRQSAAVKLNAKKIRSSRSVTSEKKLLKDLKKKLK